MDRREALSVVSMIFGGTVVGASVFLSGCKENPGKPIIGILNNKEQKLVEELAETVLPKSSDSPGAKDVDIGKFINSIVTDCYDSGEQLAFRDGIKKLDEISLEKYKDEFIKLKQENKQNLLLSLEKESKEFNKELNKGNPIHYYSMMKQLTVWGYLSSEKVGTQVLRHVPIPGRFEGCLPYEKGEKAYS